MRVNPAHVRVLMQTIACLHNYCLNENNNYEVAAYGVMEDEMVVGGELILETAAGLVQTVEGVSTMREVLVERVKIAGLTRP